MDRVVITGIAPITAIGSGNAFFENLLNKKTAVRPIPPEYCSASVSTKFYVPFPETDDEGFGSAYKKMKTRSSKAVWAAAASALLAVRDSGIEKLDENTAVFFGVGVPHTEEILRTDRALTSHSPIHPCSNPMMMTSSVSAWISILLGINGINQTISTACASGTNAVGDAYWYIRSGRGRSAVCGGADYLGCENGLLLKSFDVLRTLTKSENGLPLPFSEERSGFLFSEGAACALILEEYESAKKRGARIYAEITGYGSTCDAFHIVQMPQDASQIIRMLRRLCGGQKIDYYNAHGTATVLNDKTEQYALTEVFGDSLKDIPVTSAKGIIGHTIGASGAIEAAICAYSIKNQVIHGNILGTPLAGLCLPSETKEAKIETAVSASFGFGGHNAALMFKKAD